MNGVGQTESTRLCYNTLMKKWLLLSIVAFIALMAMMFGFSPSNIGPLGILLFFTTCYVPFLGLAVICCRLFFILKAKWRGEQAANLNKRGLYYGAAIALAPLLLLMMGSIGGIAIFEVILVVLLEILLCFLVSHSRL